MGVVMLTLITETHLDDTAFLTEHILDNLPDPLNLHLYLTRSLGQGYT